MTKKQFDRAIQISKSLDELKKLKEEIKNTSIHRLSYNKKGEYDDFKEVSSFTLRPIRELLDRHDKMIREEIDDEIDKLTREIWEL